MTHRTRVMMVGILQGLFVVCVALGSLVIAAMYIFHGDAPGGVLFAQGIMWGLIPSVFETSVAED